MSGRPIEHRQGWEIRVDDEMPTYAVVVDADQRSLTLAPATWAGLVTDAKRTLLKRVTQLVTGTYALDQEPVETPAVDRVADLQAQTQRLMADAVAHAARPSAETASLVGGGVAALTARAEQLAAELAAIQRGIAAAATHLR